MPSLLQDLTGAVRRAGRTPSFFLAAAGLIALAIAGNTATFTLIHAVLLRSLPVRAESTVLTLHAKRTDTPRGAMSLPMFQELAGARTFPDTAAYFQWSANLTGTGDAERLQGMRVTGNYFDVLGARASLGRVIRPDDVAAGSGVVVISDGVWKRRFGAAADIAGRTLLLNGERMTIVGVLPPDFPMQIRDTEVIAPWNPATDPRRTNASLAFLRVIARRAADATSEQVLQELSSRLRGFRQKYPNTPLSADGHVVPFREDLLGTSPRLLAMLAGGMAIVMLVAAANLANLLLVHGAGRAREFTTRRALGASRGRLMMQILVELLVFGAAGTAAGIMAAPAITALLLRWGGPSIPIFGTPSLDPPVILFAVASGLLLTLAAGIVPAAQLTVAPTELAAQRGSTLGGRRLRAAFVCAEVTLSVLLVAGAGLLVRSFVAVQRVDPGFESSGVFTMRLSLPRARYPKTADIAVFEQALAARLRAVPGATTVAASNVVPMNNYLASAGIRPPGMEAIADSAWPESHYRMISGDYFTAMGIDVLEGRAFTDADRAGAAPVAIISSGLARRYWGGRSPLGAEFQVRDDTNRARPVTIVGVVNDVRHSGPEREAPFEIYVPIAQVPDATSIWLANNMYWVIRTPLSPLALSNDVRRELARVDPEVAASFVRSMDEWVGQSTRARRFNVIVLMMFALTALILAGAGVYSVAAESVAVRTRELGIRAALGAGASQLRNRVIRDGLGPLAAGIVGGTAAAAAAAGLLRPFLFGIQARDPITFGAVLAVAAIAGLAGLYLPARAATRIDPIVALRAD